MNKNFIISFILCISGIFLFCEKIPFTPDTHTTPTLSYTVTIPNMSLDSLHISLTINQQDGLRTITLMVPPMYADNPLITQTDVNFRHVSITDATQRVLYSTTDTLQYGAYKNPMISFPAADFPVTIDYVVTFNYESISSMPLPHINATEGYLQGQYLFAIPATPDDIVDIWRSPVDIEVTYTCGPDVNLFGDPQTDARFSTPYELLFSTTAALAGSAVPSQLLFEGTTQGQQFRFVNISSTTSFSSGLLDSVKADFEVLLDDIIPAFGILCSAPFTVITGINNAIGLEGMYAFCLRNPTQASMHAVSMTMAHEFMHSWVGVRVGEYNDPWWKEGTATYVGLLIPKRNGLCTREYIQETLLDTFGYSADALQASNTFALSDASVRMHLFDTPGLGTIVYRKGAQVCMLLDRRIRAASQNTTSFDRILGKFVQRFMHKSFLRNEYISFINTECNGNVQDIFNRYVDAKGTIPYTELLENFNALDSLGAFGN